MNEFDSHEPSSHGTFAALVWLGIVILFLACLGWIIVSVAPSAREHAVQTTPVVESPDPGTIMEGLREKAGTAETIPPFADTDAYVLAGAGTQGMFQQTAPDGAWTFDATTPELAVQVIKRGPPSPQLLTEGISVTWELEQTAGLADPETPRRGTMEVVEDSHFQASIPVSALRDDGTVDPYPVVTLRAEDAATGEALAQTAVVLAVSPGFGCAHCHENSGKAILEVHDRHQGTTLLEQNAKGEVVSCRSCHVGPPAASPDAAADASPEAAPAASTAQANAAANLPLGLSAAIHGWHAAYLPDKGADACMSCHIALGRVTNASKDAPQNAPKMMFARDMHIERGLSCVSCHGVLEDHALALLKAEEQAGRTQAAAPMAVIPPRAVQLDAITPRLPWTQEPDCASCHDFTVKPDPKTASAFNAWTDKSMGASALFGNNKDDMVMVRCITCHGAPHAIYKAQNPTAKDLDNIPPLQYQKVAAPLGKNGNCVVCHGEPRDFSAHHPLVEVSSESETK